MREKTIRHGFARKGHIHPIYRAWTSMKSRCSNANVPNWEHYGGRGVQVCERWMKFENFRDDMFSTWQQGLELDRINNDGNYEPSNCKWSTVSQNLKNRRNHSEFQSEEKGVTWDKNNKKWVYKESFASKEEAEIFAISRKNGGDHGRN